MSAPGVGERRLTGDRTHYQFDGTVPGDKSISHRAVLLSLLSAGQSRIVGLGLGEDVKATLQAARAFGADVLRETGGLVVTSPGLDDLREPADVIDAQNSGTTARMLLGVAAAARKFCVLTGDSSLKRRPMDRVTRPLAQLGAQTGGRSGGGYLPIAVMPAPLHGAQIPLPVASAQVKSAVLLAGLAAAGDTEVQEPAPTRDHTERMLNACGVTMTQRTTETGVWIGVHGGARPAAHQWRVPGDPSSAAFHVAAALLLGGRVRVRQVSVNPGRTGFFSLVRRMGAKIREIEAAVWDGEPVADIEVTAPPGGLQLSATRVDGAEVPGAIDELPLIGILAARAVGRTEVHGAAELRVKESDRIHGLIEGLTAFGVTAGETADGFWVEGPAALNSAQIDPRGDHRMAMGFGLLGLAAPGESVILGGQAAAVSYPQFWQDILAAVE